MCVCACTLSHSVMSDSLQPHGLYLARLLCPRNSPGKNTGVGCHSLFQGIFTTQGSNPGLLHCRQILYCLSHQGSPRSLPRALYVLETQETLEFQRNVCLCESGELRTLSPERQGQTTVGSLVYELILLFQWHPGDRLMCTAYCIPCTCVCG